MLKLVARILKLVTELSSTFKRSNYFDNPTKLCPHFLLCPHLLRFYLCYCFFFVFARFIIAFLVSSGQIGPTYCVVPDQIHSDCMSAKEWKRKQLFRCRLINSAGRWL